MKKLTKIEKNEATAAWEKYHGGVKFDDGEDYFPDTPPMWLRAFLEGMKYQKEQAKK